MEDMSAVSIDAIEKKIPGRIVQTFQKDTTPPELKEYTLNMETGTLTLDFTESVSRSSLKFTAITIQAEADSSLTKHTYTLTGGTCASNDGTTMKIELSSDDHAAIKARTKIAHTEATTFISYTNEMITDTAFIAVRVVAAPVSSAKAVKAGGFTKDSKSPTITSFSIDLNAAVGSIRIGFDEPVFASTFQGNFLTIQEAKNRADGKFHALTGGSLAAESVYDGTSLVVGTKSVVIKLSSFDQTKLKEDLALAADISSTFLSSVTDAFKDTFGNPCGPISFTDALPASEYSGDTTAAKCTKAVMNIEQRKLTLTFDDVVKPSVLKVDVITIASKQSAPTNEQYRLKSSTTQSSNGFEVVIELSEEDALGLALTANVGTGKTNTYISFLASVIADVGGNDVTSITQERALQVDSYVADATAPVLLKFEVDLSTNKATLYFSESVDVTNIDTTKLTLHGLAAGSKRVLSSAQCASANGDTLQKTAVFTIATADLSFIKKDDNMGTKVDDTLLTVQAALVKDVYEVSNAVRTQELKVDKFTADNVAPKMVSFTFNINTGDLAITFDEPVRANTASVASALTLRVTLNTDDADAQVQAAKEFALTGS
eukprot:UC1_evm1s1